ncbi:MAG: DUF58 domain-containing protein [Alphaproteobacteria bacterium]
MKQGVNSSVFVSPASLAALKKKAQIGRLPDSKRVSVTGTGTTKSPFKTKGMDFSEVRQYQAGDDVRQIDWRVTAKYGKPFTKLYTDEKEQHVFFICDLRTAMKFASHGDFKSVVAAKITAFLAWVAESKQDGVRALLILPDNIKLMPARTGEEVILPLLNEISASLDPFVFNEDIISLVQVTQRLESLVPKGALVFICSDFHDLTPESAHHIGRLSQKARVSFIHIFDAMEEKMPAAVLPVTNGAHCVTVDMRDKKNQKIFKDSFTKIQSMVADTVTTYKLGYLPVRTDENYIGIVARYCEGTTV